MSDSRSSKLDEMTSRIKDAVANAEGNVDAEGLMSRIRETVGKAGSDVDTDAIVARVKNVVGQAEGRVDADKLRQWVADVDRDKLKGWLDEAKTMGAGAVSLVEAQGEKLVERAPGALDKVLGVAKETVGGLTGNQDLAREGELQHLKGDIQERLESAAGTVEGEAKVAADTVRAKAKRTTD